MKRSWFHRIVWLSALAVLVAACSRTSAPAGPASQPVVLVASELGPLGDQLGAALSTDGLVWQVKRAPTADLVERIKVDGADAVIGLGPNDLIPLDSAALIKPATGLTIAAIPLVLLTSAQADLPPQSLDDLAQGDYPIGVPDKASGYACKVVKKALSGKNVKCNEERFQAASLEQLVLQVSSGELPAAVVPATAILGHEDAAEVAAMVPEQGFEVVALVVEGAPRAALLGDQPFAALTKERLTELLAGTRLTVVGPRSEAAGEGLFVYAGAGIREPLDTAAALFTAQTGIKVRYSYTGSACLLAQITLSRQGDVYIPGERFFMDQAKSRGYIASDQPLAWFIPVIGVQKGNPKQIKTLEDLAQPGLRVGIGEAKSCAVGTITERLLDEGGLTDKIAPNVILRTPMAPELGTALKLGSIDACINWDAVSYWYLDAIDVVPINPSQNVTTQITAGVLQFAKHPEEALKFVDFLAGTAGRGVFEAAHYTVDPKQPIFPSEATR